MDRILLVIIAAFGMFMAFQAGQKDAMARYVYQPEAFIDGGKQ